MAVDDTRPVLSATEHRRETSRTRGAKPLCLAREKMWRSSGTVRDSVSGRA
jgi:hypothetical protein